MEAILLGIFFVLLILLLVYLVLVIFMGVFSVLVVSAVISWQIIARTREKRKAKKQCKNDLECQPL